MTDEHTTRVIGMDLPISTKQAIEISNFIRGKTVKESKRLLEGVMVKKIAVPFKRFNRDMGHRKGRIAAGRFPQKSSKYIIKLLNTLESNAANKGLDGDALYIKSITSNQASRPWHNGRFTRRRMKRTHIKIIAEEIMEKKETRKQPVAKSQPKVEKPQPKVEKPQPKVEKSQQKTEKKVEQKK